MIIHIIVSYDQNISLIFLMWKMDPMSAGSSGFDIRLVFTLPPRDSTLQYKRCVHFWNNFPCIKSLFTTGFSKNKILFSQIRRELSEQGSEHFLAGENDLVLEYYNRALMYRYKIILQYCNRALMYRYKIILQYYIRALMYRYKIILQYIAK